MSGIIDRATARDLYVDGATYQAIGEKYGVSRQAVEQILKKYFDITELQSLRKQKRAEERNAELWQQLEERMRAAKPCPVCRCWVLRKTSTTCSPECAHLWRTTGIRYQLDPPSRESARRSHARWILKNPHKVSETRIAWAERMLSSVEPLPRNRSYIVKGSRTYQLMKERGLAS